LIHVFLDHLGSCYYQQFNQIYQILNVLHENSPHDGSERQEVTHLHQKKKKSTDHVEQSHFRESIELYDKLLAHMNYNETNDANQTTEEEKDDIPRSQVTCLPLLRNYAKICFDIHQKEILPMRISIQCFTIIALRVRKFLFLVFALPLFF
jgi:hypothetical protein